MRRDLRSIFRKYRNSRFIREKRKKKKCCFFEGEGRLSFSLEIRRIFKKFYVRIEKQGRRLFLRENGKIQSNGRSLKFHAIG